MFDGSKIAFQLGTIGLVPNRLPRNVFAFGDGNVLGNIDDHRSRAAGVRNVKRFVDDARQVIDILHEIVVLGARPGNADGVRLLKGVIANEMRGHLTRQAHDGNAVHHRVGEPGHRVGRPRTRGHEDDTGLARGAGVSLGHVRRALFMPHEHMANPVLLEYGVVERKYGTARVTENHVDPLILKCLEDDL